MANDASRWTALLLAGSRPGGDPFAAANGVELKPLIPIAGEPMLLRPLRALLAVAAIDEVRVLTNTVAQLTPVIPPDPRVNIAASGRTIATTIEAILTDPATCYPLLVTTADHALLTPAMIEQFLATAAGADLAIGLVERRALDARLPQTKRTWLGFKAGSYSGANLFAIGSPRAAPAIALWAAVEQDRKKGWRMLLAFGPALLLGAVLRLRTLDQSLAAIGHKLGISLRAVELADPLAAVDVDKPADLALVTAIIAGAA
ncbi:NTP transferase domain-containing protein [Sphingomonas sp. RB1R13]|uniref:NTP transferase domain-containing protein n=1 Tax=Sphingomonas sp. RB1R13 TaxID=3096159 RepID=UPI002FCB55FF